MGVAARVAGWDLRKRNLPGPMLPSGARTLPADPFPQTALPVAVEVLLGGSWVDITPYVYQRDGIRISRGRTSESTTATVSNATLTLDNRDGRFSPRNPTGPYYGVIGRNTQLRIGIVDPNAPWAIRWRHHGEVSEWPARWDTSGSDVYVPVTASGIMRRLEQGASPLKSPYYRGCTSTVAPVAALQAYWPLEDGAAATSMASPLTGVSAMQMAGTPTLATDSESFIASDALPTMGTASFKGTVPSHTATGEIQVFFLMSVPDPHTNGAIIMRLECGGTATRWDLVYGTGGTLTLQAYDEDDTLIVDSGAIAFAVDGIPFQVGLFLVQDGADVDWTFSTLRPGRDPATGNYWVGNYWAGTEAAATITKATSVTVAPTRNLTNVTIGHVTVQSQVSGDVFELAALLAAYEGSETAAGRIERLCAEEGIDVTVQRLYPGDSSTMGAQTIATLMTLIRECETTDAGILYEARDSFALAYRTRASLCVQAATLALNYAAADLSVFEPVEDDQGILNDVTVTRPRGSSARDVAETGALSVQAPPDGVGRYDTSVSVNPSTDTVLADHASWRVHLGTVNEARYPMLGVDMARPNFAASTVLNASTAVLDVGDRVTVANPPAWIPPEDISQLAVGFAESLNNFEWTITANCTPESPYHVGVYDDSVSRYTSDGSTVNGIHDATTVTLSVATPSGPLWAHDDGDYDCMVGGERMTVTGVSGASSPQSFTVTRSVNGVVKGHLSGAEVQLFHPVFYAI